MPKSGRNKDVVPRIAVIVSGYNASITDRLREGAIKVIASRLRSKKAAVVFAAPGAFELPALALVAAQTGEYAGIVALGCLIRGQTRHDRYIAAAVAHGLVEVTLATGVPVGFGVITAETAEQAGARAGGAKGNKGEEAAHAVLDAAGMIEAIWLGGVGVNKKWGKRAVAGRAMGQDKARRAVQVKRGGEDGVDSDEGDRD